MLRKTEQGLGRGVISGYDLGTLRPRSRNFNEADMHSCMAVIMLAPGGASKCVKWERGNGVRSL